MITSNIISTVLATCILGISFPLPTNSFQLLPENEVYSPFNNLLEGIDISPDLQHEWLIKAVTPTYFHELLKLSQSNSSSERMNSELGEFLKKLLDGVTGNSCKVHVTEWFWRMNSGNSSYIISERDEWVLQMIDSWGKPPEGILSGHVNAYGDFDECIQIKVEDLQILNNIYSKNNISRNFEGQYCTSYILDYTTAMQITPKPIGDKKQQKNMTLRHGHGGREFVSLDEFLTMLRGNKPIIMPLIPSVAVCMPNSCSYPDVQQILVNGLRMVYKATIPGYNAARLPWPVTLVCSDMNRPPMNQGTVVMITLLGILVGLAVIAGVTDYYWHQRGKNSTTAISHSEESNGYKYLMAFSLYTNIKKWLNTRKSPDDLGCLHGIRFFSTVWVVLAHTYIMFVQAPLWNRIDINNIHKDWTSLAIINGTFSVDTFFVMSGMLATYGILKTLEKTDGQFNIIMFYIHRYIRLTPAYAILVGIAATLFTYTGNGPTWQALTVLEEYCRKNWWTNILYINNLVNTEEMCNGESWYLANDMQFYILTPFIVYPMWKWEMMGGLLLTIYTIMFCIAPVLVVRYAHNNPPAMLIRADVNTTEIYMRPWSRISPFLVGIWLGWILHAKKGQRVQIFKPLALTLWLCSAITALAVVFGIYPWFDPANKITRVQGYFYAGLSRFSWAVAVSWVIFACVKDYGGLVNKFLSWKVFIPLGRLSFCVYLISIHLQTIFHLRLSVPIKWDAYTVTHLFFAHLVMSYIAGFICTLLFESPFITLQKLIFEGKIIEKNSSVDMESNANTIDITLGKAMKINQE